MEPWELIQAFCIQSLQRHLPVLRLDMPGVKGQNKEKQLLRAKAMLIFWQSQNSGTKIDTANDLKRKSGPEITPGKWFILL